MVGSFDLTLREGDPEQVVRLQSNFPPAAICPNRSDPDTCHLAVHAGLLQMARDELVCPGLLGGVVPQAVVQWLSPDKDGCDLRLTGTVQLKIIII
jgi:hypothetical protein